MTGKDQGLILHELLLAGDSLALPKLYDTYGDNIVNILRADFSELAKRDESLLFEAVNDAFIGYNSNPQTFDHNKNTLKNFLIMAAKRDLLNIISRNKNYQEKIKLPEDVEVEEKQRNIIQKNKYSPDEEIVQRESLQLIDIELRKYFLIDKDLEMAKMIIRGERQTEAFAIVLEVERLEKSKQQEEVKKHKDRIKKVIERNQIESKLKKLLQ